MVNTLTGAWRPHGTKVGGFLSRIQTFASIGDVLIGGSQNLIATSVWSAVRLSLTVGLAAQLANLMPSSDGPLSANVNTFEDGRKLSELL